MKLLLNAIKILTLFFCFWLTVSAQQDEHDRAMNQQIKPFKIIGNIYYVGASDVTSYLITTPKGHILIDGGFAETAPQIKQNIELLGFDLNDVKILLNNHAHYDHCGGLALLKQWSGAKLWASPADAPVLEDGGKSDFRYGGKDELFTPVKVDKLLTDGEKIKLGDTELTIYFTPGHTKGATTWTMNVLQNGKKYAAVFVSSLSTLDYKLIDNPKYPNIAADYEHTFKKLKTLNPDVFLGSHGQFFNLIGKSGKLADGSATNPFIDPAGYQTFIADMERAYRAEVKKQQ